MSNHILPLLSVVGAHGGPRPRRRSHRPLPPLEELGKWIWARGVEPRNSYIYARRVFELDVQPADAIVKASADSGYRLYVNGVYVGQGPAKSGTGWSFYDSFDIAGLLRKGDNVIACLAHHIGEDTYSSQAGKPGLLVKVEIVGPEGRKVIATDETWNARRADDWTSQGIRISKGLGFQEVYDSGLRLDGWTDVKYKDKDWEPAEVVGIALDKPWGDLIARAVPNLCAEVVYPASVVGLYNSPERPKDSAAEDIADLMSSGNLSPLKSGSVRGSECLAGPEGQTKVTTPRGNAGVAILLDFGREVSGNVEIGVAGSTTGTIDLGYCELIEEGHVKPNRGDAKYIDLIVLRKGRFQWRSFEPRAFRYLQMEFRWCGKPVAIDYVRVSENRYPVESSGSFDCSDPVLNDIWKAGVNTTLACMQDIFLDSPRLERAQWWGDARILSRAAYYLFGDTALLASGLNQFARAQKQDGSIPGLYPSGHEKMVPDFALMWVFSVLDYYAFSKDAALVADLYPSVRGLMEWFLGYLDQDGLLADVPGDPFIDWKEIESRGNVTALNCLCHQALRVAAFVASVAGRDAEAEAILDSAAALRLAINKFLYYPRLGLYATSRVDGKLSEECDPQSNTLAVLCDIADQYQMSSILRWLGDSNAGEIATPYFASFVLEALYAADRHEEALQFMKQRWGVMVADGVGTLWEEFGKDGGLCQGWAVSPARDLIAEYVGIKPAMSADRYSIAPHVGGLTWAMGSVSTESGDLSVSWRKSRNQFTMRVVVPKGIRADVYPPGPPEGQVTLDGRQNPSRILSLIPGTHQIKITEPRPSKTPKVLPELEPAPIAHVQVLDHGLRPPRRSPRAAIRRGSPDRSEPVAVAEDRPAVDVEDLGSQLPPVELQTEEPEVHAETPVAADQPKPRRHRPRTPRGGGRSRKPQLQNEPESGSSAVMPHAEQAPPAETPTGAAPDAADSSGSDEAGSQPKPRRHRPRASRGGGRSRKSKSEPPGESGPASDTASSQ